MDSSTDENKAHLRSKYKNENKKEEIKVSEDEDKKNKTFKTKGNQKRIAIIHVDGNGDPNEIQRISPQVQVYLKVLSNQPNTIVDLYPDNEAKFNLPYQCVAPFPIEVTDHLYWSEETLESFADDLWNHWLKNRDLMPTLIITIGPGAVYVSNIIFERHFWKIPWIYQGHWDIPTIDRVVNPDYFRIEEYAFSAADLIVFNSIKQREESLVLREQSMTSKCIVVNELEERLDDLRREGEEKFSLEKQNGHAYKNEYYGLYLFNRNRTRKNDADALIGHILNNDNDDDENDVSTATALNKKEKVKRLIEESETISTPTTTTITPSSPPQTSESTTNNQDNEPQFPVSSKLKSNRTENNNRKPVDVVDHSYKNMTTKQKYEWNKKYGIDEEELIGKKRDAYDRFLDKYTQFIDVCNKLQTEQFTKKQSRPYYVFNTLQEALNQQEKKKKFSILTLFLPIIFLILIAKNITIKYEIPRELFLGLLIAYAVYTFVERLWITPKPVSQKQNIMFLGKLVFIAIGLVYGDNMDVRAIGTGSLILFIDYFWVGLKECLVYELNLNWTIVKLIHVMFVRLILFPFWFFVALIDRYQIQYFIYFALMYIVNWEKSYKALEEYLFLVE